MPCPVLGNRRRALTQGEENRISILKNNCSLGGETYLILWRLWTFPLLFSCPESYFPCGHSGVKPRGTFQPPRLEEQTLRDGFSWSGRRES